MTNQQRQLQEKKLVIATSNTGKLREFSDFFSPWGIEAISVAEAAHAQGQLWQAPEETGKDFRDNARIKAHSAACLTGLPALADDSGLVIHALDGEPGLYSARWAGPQRDYQQAMERILNALKDQADRTAAFMCALALVWPDGYQQDFQGHIDGHIAYEARGQQGFGYDPIFIAQGHTRTFAEMNPESKASLSHRNLALIHMARCCMVTASLS